MYKIKSKKAMELPLNIVIMMIIGIVIFGLGMSLFSKISNSGNQQISDLNDKIKADISSIECSGEDWVCFPAAKLRMGKSQLFSAVVSNKDDVKESLKINFPKFGSHHSFNLSGNNCGSIKVYYPSASINVTSSDQASFPVMVYANNVSRSGCSFVTPIEVKTSTGTSKGKSTFIVNIQ